MTLTLVAVGALLLTVFVFHQSRSRNPLLPLDVFADRNRTGAYLTMLLLAVGPMGTFYVITLHLQQVQQLSPLQTGFAWLPFAFGIVLGAGAAPKMLLKTGPRAVATTGACSAPPRRTGSPPSPPTPPTGPTSRRPC